jgi:hypothetical protein
MGRCPSLDDRLMAALTRSRSQRLAPLLIYALGLSCALHRVSAFCAGRATQEQVVDAMSHAKTRTPYIQAVLREPVTIDRWDTERKTGVERAEVITVGLVRDERGWLRLSS